MFTVYVTLSKPKLQNRKS